VAGLPGARQPRLRPARAAGSQLQPDHR